MSAPPPVPASADRAYAALLRLYPAAFRDEYASEMRQAFRSRWRDERRQRGGAGMLRLWLSVILDALATAPSAHFDILMRDVRYGIRTLSRRSNLSFTVAALLTLALGIGAVTVIFTIVRAALFAPLPYRDADRLVAVYPWNPSLGITRFSESKPNFLSVQERARSFSGLVAMRGASANLTGGAEPERVSGLAVSPSFWSVLGMAPVAGRAFVESDDAAGQRVAMISQGLWARRYGSDPSAVGRTIGVNLVPHVIVGVAPQNAGFASDVDIWTTLGRDDSDPHRGDRRLNMIARLAPGVSLVQARDELDRVASQLEREFPDANRNWRLQAIPVRDWIVQDDIAVRLRLLLAAVALLLVVAAANVANLQVARAADRLREIGVRLALGASRARLARQMLTENLILAGAGGALGVALAWAGVRAAAARLPASIPRVGGIEIDWVVVAVACGCIVATTLLAGLLPASVAMRSSVQDALQRAGRSAASARTPARKVLVAVQLALATTLVVCAALLAQSLAHLQRVPLGFGDPPHLLTARVTRSVVSEAAHEKNLAFYDAAVEQVRALPGVISAGITSEVPFGDANTSMPVGAMPRQGTSNDAGVSASWRLVTNGYFETMQIPVQQGRLFDRVNDPLRVMVLSAGLARRLWPGGDDPIGRTVWLGNGQVFRIVGVVGDVRQVGLANDPTPTMYIPISFFLWPTMTLVVRTHGDPAALTRPIRDTVLGIDPQQPLAGFQTMEQAIAANAAAPRLNAVVLASFAGLALLLAAVGVAGLASYAVARRTPELAVRMALGASPRQAMQHVMADSMLMCVAGIAAGLAAALAVGTLLSSVLFGVTAYDPRTFAAAAVALLAIATVACWLPARRATRISPSAALRQA